MKKLFAGFVALCMILSGIGVSAQQSPELQYATAVAPVLTDGVIPPQPDDSAPVVATYANEEGQDIYSTIYYGLLYHEETIDISAFGIPFTTEEETETVLSGYMGDIINYYPELFAAKGSYGYSYSDIVVEITPQYRIALEDYVAALEKYAEEVTKITSGIPGDFSDLEKIVYVHDYFAEHYEYDKTLFIDKNAAIYDAYNFFVQHKGVCQAYTLAYMAIMREIGVECVPALDNPDNHAWNIIGLNGKYYHVDNTWDDPGYISGYVSHDYLLLSNGSINKSAGSGSTGGHSAWYVPDGSVTADMMTDTTYEGYAWTKSESSLNYYDGKWYMLRDNGKTGGLEYAAIYSLDRNFVKTGASSPSIKSSPWWVTDSGGGYYLGFYSGMNRVGNTLYGNTFNGLWSYNIDTNAINYLSVPGGADHIYGSTYSGAGRITYSVKTDPNTETETLSAYQLTLGDTDGDGEFLANDLINAKKLILTGSKVKNWGLIDLNEDGIITVVDYIRMKKLFAGK